MSNNTAVNLEGIEQIPLSHFTKKAYLDYAMYVIRDRALPFIGDGLKPVQRRIVFAMSELGLKASSKFKKSARTVGDVLGKYHPHGDAACYEAMVLMAQPFSYRYPLINGQGNWGAPDDPKSFAAMRYTEAKLSQYSETLLSELQMGTAPWGPNFDGTLKEPLTLPARLPNILLNGTTGIAVGMATDVPPHNIREVVEACILLIDRPTASIAEICESIQGPDFPCGAEVITPPSEIVDIYRNGRGSLRMRATYELENGEIVITSLPHQVSPSKVLEQIALQMSRKKLPMVSDLRDESDHEDPIRLIIVPRSNRVDKEAVMAHLFATTDMEKTCRVNMNLIGIDRKPAVHSLKSLLTQWIRYRFETVRKRLEFHLSRVVERLHILDGLLAAYLNLDEVIRIIRKEDKPKPVLMAAFNLTEVQVEAILQMRLRHLARLEEIKIRKEQEGLADEKKKLELVLGSKARFKTLIKKELRQDAATFGDERRTQVVERMEAQAISQEELSPVESVTVILSTNGWVRSAKGHDLDPEGINYRAGDGFLSCARGKSNQPAIFLDSTGRTYSLPVHSLASARSHGEPLTGRFVVPKEAVFIATMMGSPSQEILLASDAGYGFVTTLEALVTKNQKGKALIRLPAGAKPLAPVPVQNRESDLLAAVTNEGRLLLFPLANLPVLSKGKGNKIISIPSKRSSDGIELLTHLSIIPNGAGLLVYSGKQYFRLTPGNTTDYMGERGRRGKMLPRGYRNVEQMVPEISSQQALL